MLLKEAPFMRGGDYLNTEVMMSIWQDLSQALLEELKPFEGHLQNYLIAHHSAWNKVGRICFHLAENKASLEHPFAFLTTYTTGLSNTGYDLLNGKNKGEQQAVVKHFGDKYLSDKFLDAKHLEVKHLNVKHLPLGQALKDYSGEDKRSHLLSLLLPVQKASEKVPL